MIEKNLKIRYIFLFIIYLFFLSCNKRSKHLMNSNSNKIVSKNIYFKNNKTKFNKLNFCYFKSISYFLILFLILEIFFSYTYYGEKVLSFSALNNNYLNNNEFILSNNITNTNFYNITKNKYNKTNKYTNKITSKNPINITYYTLGMLGLGNRLNQYWYYRAFAYWNDLSFNIKKIENRRMRSKITSNKGRDYLKFINFLPNHIKYEVNHKMKTKLETKQIISFNKSFTIEYFLSFFNKPMIDIITNETEIAIEKYFKRKKKIEYNITDCDIAIHLRCGDIFNEYNDEYSFMTLGFYQYGIFELLKRNNKTECLKESSNKNNLWLVAQITENGVHIPHEIESISDCKIIAKNIQHKLIKIYKSYVVNIVSKDIINDFNLMRLVPFLICDTSTFCYHSGIANINKNIAFPIKGPWYIKKAIGTDLIPDSYLFIEGYKKGWQINSLEITKRKWNINVEELIYFILTN